MSIKSIFASFGHFFVSIWDVFRKGDVRKIREEVKQFTEIAYPIVKMIVNATPTNIDNLLLQAAEKIYKSGDNTVRTAEDIIFNIDELVRDGGRQRIAVEAIKLRLIDLVNNKGKIELGTFVIETIEDVVNIDKTLLLTAVQDTYRLIKEIELKKTNKEK